MNIGIDVNCLIFERAGFGRYTYNLVKNLLKVDGKNHYFLYATFIRKRKEREKILRDLVKETQAENVTIRIIPIPAAWKEFLIGLPISIRQFIKDPIDIYFAPHFAGIPKKGFEKMVVAIHDLAFIKYPEHRGKKLSRYYLKRTKIALAGSKNIIAISEATKRDLLSHFDLGSGRVEVIPEAVTENYRNYEDQELVEQKISAYIPHGVDYLLSVGTLEPRKNHALIIKAFALLPNDLKRKYRLVFVGGSGWNNQSFMETIKNYNLEGKVIFPGFVEEKILPYIYNRASIFIFPSLYEGFGLPPLEAMACGTPVVTSNCASLSEVVDDAAILINPRNEEELAAAIKKILLNKKIAQKLSRAGVLRAKKFSWEKVAKKTLKVFERTYRA